MFAIAVALGTAAIAIAFALAPRPAEARDPNCGVKIVCLWEHNNYKGNVSRIFEYEIRRATGNGGVRVRGPVKGRVSSIVNTTGLRICYAAPPDYSVFLGAYSRHSQMRPQLNDKVTRILKC